MKFFDAHTHTNFIAYNPRDQARASLGAKVAASVTGARSYGVIFDAPGLPAARRLTRAPP
jgi:hypothetical protein